MSFEPSLVRRALDYLLDAYPMFEVVSIDWADAPNVGWGLIGPWVRVDLGQPSETMLAEDGGGYGEYTPTWAIWQFAIWKRTGALHSMSGGAVSDDPIWTP